MNFVFTDSNHIIHTIGILDRMELICNTVTNTVKKKNTLFYGVTHFMLFPIVYILKHRHSLH